MAIPDNTSVVTLDLLTGKGTVYGPDANWNLHVDAPKGNIQRMPVLFGLPASNFNKDFPPLNKPQAWGLDIGMMQEYVEVHGYIDDWESDPSFINMTHLMEVSRLAGTGSTGNIDSATLQYGAAPGGVILHIGTGHNQGATNDRWDFKGFVLGLNWSRDGGNLYYEYTLRVGLTFWPANMHI